MRSGWVLALAGLCSAGCGAEVTELSLEGLAFDYAFLVTANAQGDPIRVLEPSVARASGGLPAGELLENEARVYVVALSEAALERAAPGFEPTRSGELRLRVEAPPPGLSFLTRDPGEPPVLRLAVPPATRVFVGGLEAGVRTASEMDEVDFDATALAGRLTLLAPVAADRCARVPQERLTHFGADPRPLWPSRDALDSPVTRDLDWIDDDRILLSTVTIVGVVRRGEVFTRPPRASPSEPRPYVQRSDFADVWRPGDQFEGAVLSPHTVDGRRTLVVYGGRPPDRTMTATISSGFVVTGWLQADGIVVEGFERYEDFHIDRGVWSDELGVVLGGEFGRLLRRLDPDGPFEVWHRLPTIETFDPEDPNVSDHVWSMLVPADDPRTLVASTEGRVHSLRDGAWSFEEIRQEQVVADELYKFLSLGAGQAGPEGRELWVGSQVGDLWRLPFGGTPVEFKPFFPVGFSACAGSVADDGALELGRRSYNDVAEVDQTLFFALERCVGLALMRYEGLGFEDPCVTVLGTEDIDRTTAPSEPSGDMVEVATRPGAVATTTALGELFVSEW